MSVLPHGSPIGRTRSRRPGLGGTTGNETLTRTTAAVLTVLLLAEGITVLDVGGMLTFHMFIGLVLIPPVLLKLASTSYRMMRYYTGARPTERRDRRRCRCGCSRRFSSPRRSGSSPAAWRCWCSATGPTSS